MSKYKRLSGKHFVVDYPAALWSGLSPREQLEIVYFYNDTYGKAASAATKTGKHGRACCPANGSNLAGLP